MTPEATITCRTCPVCHTATTLTVPTSGLQLWESGAFVQDAFPEMSVDDRELLLSGIHPACWDTLFPEDE